MTPKGTKAGLMQRITAIAVAFSLMLAFVFWDAHGITLVDGGAHAASVSLDHHGKGQPVDAEEHCPLVAGYSCVPIADCSLPQAMGHRLLVVSTTIMPPAIDVPYGWIPFPPDQPPRTDG
jgi:hypothetical protein